MYFKSIHNKNMFKNWQKIWVMLFCIGLLFLTQPLYSQQTLSDEDITHAIEAEMLVDKGVPSHLIDVSTKEGVVTLSGSVDNLLAKHRATKLAQTIKGVRSVINNITVKPVLRTDSEIENDVNNALVEDPATESFEVNVSVANGVVTLSGNVESWQEKRLAETVAKSVKGVIKVDNDVKIQYEEDRLDSEIKREIERRLTNDVWVDAMLIDVSVNDGKVTLTGKVGSAAERRWAASDAWVNGTKSVDVSNLKVVWWADDSRERQKKVAQLSDDNIKDAVKDALKYDPRLSEFNIDVKVNNGVVTLSGLVDNLIAKMSAQNDAENTLGVYRVKNFIRVRPETVPSDDVLQDKVENALERNPYVELSDVNVSVSNGKVFLDGFVNSSFEKKQAEDVAWRVIGVVEVENNIEYEHAWAKKSDWKIRQDVKDQLYWSPFVNSERISLEVDNGVVTLKGKVETWHAKKDAELNAYDGGAKDVKNKLVVEQELPKYMLPDDTLQ